MDNSNIFNDFARRAKERIEAKKKQRTKKLFVGSAGLEITVRGLTEQEIIDCSEFSDDSLVNDKYTMYMACRELQENAGALVDAKVIKNHYDICDMFSSADRHAIIDVILELSGLNEESTVKPVDEVEEAKN